jgi:hypothetical protein
VWTFRPDDRKISPAGTVSTLRPLEVRGFNAGAARPHFNSTEKGNEMQRVVSKSILASIVALAFVASIASARFPGLGHSSEKSATVTIPQSTQVPNGPTLQPGTYQVSIVSGSGTPQIAFYQDRKLVGQASAELVDQGRKSNDTEAHINSATGKAVLTEIDVSGWTKSIQFGQAAGGSGSGESGQ